MHVAEKVNLPRIWPESHFIPVYIEDFIKVAEPPSRIFQIILYVVLGYLGLFGFNQHLLFHPYRGPGQQRVPEVRAW